MSLSAIISGVNRTSKVYLPDSVGGVSLSLNAGTRGTMRLTLYDRVGASGYRAAIDDTIEVSDGPTLIFSGVIDDIDEDGLTDLDTGLKMQISASDWNAYFDHVWYVGTIAAGVTLRAALTTILSASGLWALGFTLEPANMGSVFPNGPTLTAEVTHDGPVVDILNTLQQLTGFIWRATPTKVLTMFEGGWVWCGYALSDADTNPGVRGTTRYKRSRATNYVNRVRVLAGPSGGGDTITQTWTGNGVIATFALAGVNVPASNVWPGTVNIAGVDWPIWPAGTGGPNDIEWDYATNSGTLTFKGTSVGLAVGAINLRYTPIYPFEVVVTNASEVAAHGPYDGRVPAPQVLTYAEAFIRASAIARTTATTPQRATVRTNKGIVYPGQWIALSFSERAISGTFMIMAVDGGTREDGSMEYTLTCVSGTELTQSWLDFWRNVISPTSSGTGTVVVGGGSIGSTTVVTSPIYLGGSRNTSVAPSPAAWTPVPDFVPYFAAQSTSLRLRAFVAAKHGGVSVTVRLYDETAATTVPGSTSSAITSTSFTQFTATVAIIAGHSYRLEVLNGTAAEGVLGIGQLEGL